MMWIEYSPWQHSILSSNLWECSKMLVPIRITQLCRGKKGHDISGRYTLIDYRLVRYLR